MNKLELEFRKGLCEQMKGIWNVTINVENHLTPGVPDLTYVMKRGQHETGWLELKAVSASWTPHFHVEPSQHRWIDAWHGLVPIHFLLSVGDHCYLLDGHHHSLLVESISTQELKQCSETFFHIGQLRSVLPSILSALTSRRLNLAE